MFRVSGVRFRLSRKSKNEASGWMDVFLRKTEIGRRKFGAHERTAVAALAP